MDKGLGSIGGLGGITPRQETTRTGTPSTGKGNFADVLKTKLTGSDGSGLRFSNHATRRLNDRNIELSPNEIKRLEDATDDAASKGAREALMMMGSLNFIVSVRDRTVVTAMTQDEAANAVYTNIDTAVVVGKGKTE